MLLQFYDTVKAQHRQIYTKATTTKHNPLSNTNSELTIYFSFDFGNFKIKIIPHNLIFDLPVFSKYWTSITT